MRARRPARRSGQTTRLVRWLAARQPLVVRASGGRHPLLPQIAAPGSGQARRAAMPQGDQPAPPALQADPGDLTAWMPPDALPLDRREGSDHLGETTTRPASTTSPPSSPAPTDPARGSPPSERGEHPSLVASRQPARSTSAPMPEAAVQPAPAPPAIRARRAADDALAGDDQHAPASERAGDSPATPAPPAPAGSMPSREPEQPPAPEPGSPLPAAVDSEPLPLAVRLPDAASQPPAEARTDDGEIDPARLFTAQPSDRSPQTWLDRLRQAAADEQRAAAREQMPRTTSATAPGPRGAMPAQPGAATTGATPSQAVPPIAGTAASAPAERATAPRRVLPMAAAVPGGSTAHRFVPASLAEPPRSARSAVPEPPAPLAESTRRFLRPLVGIDPASVPIHRGPEAAAMVAAQGADAVTIGEQVLLGTGHDSDTPQTLGVIAHELSHVAHARGARFLPARRLLPAVAPPSGDNGERPDPAQGAGSDGAPRLPAPEGLVDDETAASRVEAWARARATAPGGVTVAAGSPATTSPADAAFGADVDARPAHVAPTPGDELNAVRAVPGARGRWGNLPAPWEPLPQLSEMDPANAGPAAPPAAAWASPTPAATLSTARTAPLGRVLPSADGTERPAPQASEPAQPDLDLLATQVYAVLKRRLAAERRREG